MGCREVMPLERTPLTVIQTGYGHVISMNKEVHYSDNPLPSEVNE